MKNYFSFFWPFNRQLEGLSADELYRELFGITFCGILWPVLIGSALYYFGLKLTPHQQFLGIALILPVSVLAIIMVWYCRLRHDLRPIKRFLFSPVDALDDTVVSEALVRAYNFPLLSAKHVLKYQAPAFAATFFFLILLSNLFLGLNLELWQVLIAILVSFMVGISHAIFEYYAVSVPIGEVIARLRKYRAAISDEQYKRIIPFSMKQKLLLVSLFVVLPNTLILGVTQLIQFRHQWLISGVADSDSFIFDMIGWMILLVLIGGVLALFLCMRMASDVSDSANELSKAMNEVEAGKLDVSLLETTTDEFAGIYRRFNLMVSELQERERLRDAFGRYVARELAEDVMKHGANLGGEEVNASVLFADIRDFTAMSGKMTSQEIVNMLNQYFSAMSPAIKEEGGWINKFGGDSLLAVFGVLPPDENHIQHVIRSALKMRTALDVFNEKRQQQGQPPLRIGIGIHTGKMVVGSIGSEDRMEFTVIGDAVNVASRIEGLNKKWGTDILVSQEVAIEVKGTVLLQAMPETRVRGLSSLIQVYALK
ncbi:MAG: adenylate/guanylate cyclase domain-containing protein [Mariprofundus sp.]|nr:adenylate/guanylate cyclase domain-containing protein [Mariprofundus sp.]